MDLPVMIVVRRAGPIIVIAESVSIAHYLKQERIYLFNWIQTLLA
jgi:hypothetical protein